VDTAHHWLNEPPEWRGNAHSLWLKTGKETDFWRETFYGFTRDSGHAWLQPVANDFSASLTIRGDYQALYDQAGIMLRIDEARWIKAGIEFTDGLMHFSVVVTNGVSDWSVIPLHDASATTPVFVRLTRHDSAVRVQFHLGDGAWQMARLCPFPADNAFVGMTACSPQREGFEARFADFSVGSPIARHLHAD
jgi:hypothetical protein